MTEPKFTPGPWTYHGEEVALEKCCGCVVTDTGWICGFSESVKPEDARLIAAAPELYEALQGLLADITEYQEINDLGGQNNHWQIIARAALAKARGESHD